MIHKNHALIFRYAWQICRKLLLKSNFLFIFDDSLFINQSWASSDLVQFSFLSPARGRLEGNDIGSVALLSGPLAPDPVLYPRCYSARTPSHPPRIGPNATHILERGQRGVVGELLKLGGVSISPVPKQSKCNCLFFCLCWKRVVLFFLVVYVYLIILVFPF